MRFCSHEKVGLILKSLHAANEFHGDKTITVAEMRFEMALSAERAAALDDSGAIKLALFDSDGVARTTLTDASFPHTPVDQQLLVYASPDTIDSSIALNQVSILNLKAKRASSIAWTFSFSARYGPVGPTELGFFWQWFKNQQFVSFFTAEGLLPLSPAEQGQASHEQQPELMATMEALTSATTEEESMAVLKEHEGHRYPKTSKGRRSAAAPA